MVLQRRSKNLSGGWTVIDMFIIALLAALPALLVSSFFGRERRGLVFFICFVVFDIGLFISIFHWLLPVMARRRQSKRDKKG
jgi:hypothetical protein